MPTHKPNVRLKVRVARAEVVLDEGLQAATEKSLKIATIRAEKAEAELKQLINGKVNI